MATLPSIRHPSRFAALAVTAVAALRAHASLLLAARDCGASGNSLDCRLADVLSFLYVAAALLALVLMLVVVLAVRSYRRTSNNGDKGRP